MLHHAASGSSLEEGGHLDGDPAWVENLVSASRETLPLDLSTPLCRFAPSESVEMTGTAALAHAQVTDSDAFPR